MLPGRSTKSLFSFKFIYLNVHQTKNETASAGGNFQTAAGTLLSMKEGSFCRNAKPVEYITVQVISACLSGAQSKPG